MLTNQLQIFPTPGCKVPEEEIVVLNLSAAVPDKATFFFKLRNSCFKKA
jgi:hypothetical protein